MISPPIDFNAAAATTPSGVPPMPNKMSTPTSGEAAAIAAKMSPSEMRRIRAPVERTSAMRSLCRSRSRIMTVSSLTSFLVARATSWRFFVGDQSRSTACAASGPTAILSMYTHGPGLNMEPRSETAMTESAFPRPSDVRVVPSIGSTATSVFGVLPLPTRSPL